MLSDGRVYAAVPAQDLDRARRFYSEKLSLEPAEEGGGGLYYDASGGTRFLLFPTGGAPSGTHTQVAFEVADLDQEVKELRSRGVEFAEYDFPGLKTENGIAATPDGRAAWFMDSEGNVLGVFERA